MQKFLRGKKKKEPSPSVAFLQNGGLLLEKLTAASNGKYGIPILSFTSEQLTRATNNFVDHFHRGRLSNMCRGSWEGRQILVKKFLDSSSVPTDAQYDTLSGVIRDIVTNVQMSHHKNVLKILGCCLEFEHPALVYEYAGDEFLLASLLTSNSNNRSLTWRSRLKIANDIANAIVYLHSAFRTPIIYRILNPRNIIVDQFGIAKLFDFSFSISLPPGKLQVQDDVIGVNGYIDYEYNLTGIVSQKTDVFSFGVLLLVLLTGKDATLRDEEGYVHLVHYVTDCAKRNEFNSVVDTRINDAGERIPDQQLLAFTDLALKCTQGQAKHRPNMIDAAKELLDISRPFHYCKLNQTQYHYSISL